MLWINFRIKIRKWRKKPNVWLFGVLDQSRIDYLVSIGYRVRICDWEFLNLKDTVVSWEYSYDDPEGLKWLYDSKSLVTSTFNPLFEWGTWDKKPKIKRSNCNNCGAPLTSNKCEYCKTKWD